MAYLKFNEVKTLTVELAEVETSVIRLAEAIQKTQKRANALLDGRGDAFSTDNTEVLAWALSNPGFTVGIDALGNADTIAPAVQKGNTTLPG